MPAAALPLLRLVLAVAYPFLAHAASARHDGALAAVAAGDIAVIVLLRPLAAPRAWAWAVLALVVAGLVGLAHSRFAQVPMLLVPVVFVALVAWMFGGTLRVGQVPLITRMVTAMDGKTPQTLEPELRDYTRRLTAAWALLLGGLALANLVLATLARPNGLLAMAGVDCPVSVSQTQWSWIANFLDYGLVAGFFALEFVHRQRRFPGRYRNFLDFAWRMARLGPAFWRDFAR